MNRAHTGRAKTSTDILRERDALAVRVRLLERALERITLETETATERPDLAFVTLCRVATVARGSRAA
jgi:hypothetical protein